MLKYIIFNAQYKNMECLNLLYTPTVYLFLKWFTVSCFWLCDIRGTVVMRKNSNNSSNCYVTAILFLYFSDLNTSCNKWNLFFISKLHSLILSIKYSLIYWLIGLAASQWKLFKFSVSLTPVSIFLSNWFCC